MRKSEDETAVTIRRLIETARKHFTELSTTIS